MMKNRTDCRFKLKKRKKMLKIDENPPQIVKN